MAFVELFFLVIVICSLLYLWSKHNYAYWERKNIPYDKPTFLIGNSKEVFLRKQSFGLHLSDIYRKPEFENEAVVGIYALHKPGLVIRDPEVLKSVLIKDFHNFSDRYGSLDPAYDKIGAFNLFFVKNPTWKELRHKLSPVFTSGKIKQMYHLMQEVGLELEKQLLKRSAGDDQFICEVKEFSALFTTDLIASIAFGIQANCLENPSAEFRQQGRKLMTFSPKRGLDLFLVFFMPKMASLLRVNLFTNENIDFLRKSVKYVMDERERTGTLRNDLIDVLVALKKEAAADTSGKHLANEQDILVAQAAVFFTAGFETSSATISFALYELAKHQDMQKRLREELREALQSEDGKKLSYEKISSLEYLSMVLDETLRLYPIMPFLDRVYQTSSRDEQFSLKPFYDFKLENGTPVFIPVFAIQRDPKYWPNPNVFDPERFSNENKKLHHSMTYMPFGSGPRNCIGMRVGLLQAKLGLINYLKNFYVRPCKETVTEIKFDTSHPTLMSTEGIHLEFVRDKLC